MPEKIYTKAYSSIASKPIEWLWYPYIPQGKLILLQGDPGDGKSTFLLQLIALFTTGRDLPDGTKVRMPINVIYQCAEDGAADTILPRLEKSGANNNMVHFIVEEGDLTMIDYRVELSVLQTGAKLLIFDPIQSFLPVNCDMQSATKTRSVLGKLAALAEKNNCSIILVSHMGKEQSQRNIYRSLGSIDIPAACRSILMISRDEVDPSLRYVDQIKNNLAPEGPQISFSLTRERGFEWKTSFEKDGNQNRTIRPIDRGTEAAKALLDKGPIPSETILNYLKQIGLTETTARRALRKTGATCHKKGSHWYWQLPDADRDEDIKTEEE